MAVVIAVTGKYNDQELKRAQADLAKLQAAGATTANGLATSFQKVGASMKTAGAKMSSIGRTATYSMTLPIVAGLALATKGWIDHNKVVAQSEAVIKSTGGAAGVTAEEMDVLATRLERISTIDGDVILSGENMLATFTNIRNEVGRGNDIFTQSTKVALDMSVALGQDMKSSAMQLGKALNDPIKGLTALQRVGVAFTEKQKEQITTLTEAGKVQEAQKIILAELNKEFGGSAKAAGKAAGPMGKLLVSLRQIGDSIGAIVLPVIQKLSVQLERAAAWFEGLSEGQKQMIVLMAAIAAAVGPVLLVLGSLLTALGTIAGAIGAVIGAIGLGPLLIVVAAIGAAAFLIIKNWSTLKPFFQRIWAAITDVVGKAWAYIQDTIIPAMKKVWGYVAPVLRLMGRVFKTEFKAIWAVVKFVFDKIKPYIQAAMKILGVYVKAGIAVIKFAFDKIRDVVNVVRSAFGNVKDIIRTVMGTIKSIWRTAWNGLKEVVTNVWDGIVSGIKGSVNLIIDAINVLIRGMNNLEFSAPSWVPGIGGKSWGVDIPEIPHLAKGGIVQKSVGGTVAVVGEGRYDEAVIPLTPQLRRQGLGGNHATLTLTQNIDARGADASAIPRIKQAARDAAEEAFAVLVREMRAS